MVQIRDHSPGERARLRAARYRLSNLVDNVPSTRDLDRAIVIGNRWWLQARGIRSPGDLIDIEIGAVLDEEAVALIAAIERALKDSRFDMRSPVTRGRLFARLGIGPSPTPRPRADEFDLMR